MFILLILAIYIIIVLVRVIQPVHTRIGHFELTRRAEKGDKTAEKILGREKLLPLIVVLRNFVILILGACFLATAITAYGLLAGILLALFMVVSIVPLVRIKVLVNFVAPYYQKYEMKILKFASKISVILKFFRTVSAELNTKTVDSKDELLHIIETTDSDIVPMDEKKIIVAALKFSDGIVADIMTPADKIIFVENREVLGPLVLDRLSKTSFQRFPVFDRDPNHIVGILNIKKLLNLELKDSPRADKMMSKKVYFVREDSGLDAVLSAFQRNNCYFLMVVNKKRETVGIVTISDLFEKFFGRRISDGFDSDDNIVAVSERPNNSTKDGEDL